MNEKDIKIGNSLLLYGEVVKVTEIGFRNNDYYLRVEGNKNGYYLDQFEPIRLTEEILLKCGFEQKDHLFRLHLVNSLSIIFNSECNLWFFDIYMNTSRIELQYLHELQNIYSSITFKEL